MEKDAVGYPFNGHTNSDIRRYLASRLPYRELTRIRASGSLVRLDSLVATGQMTYAPITTAEWRQAAISRPTPPARPTDRFARCTRRQRHPGSLCGDNRSTG